MITTNPFTIDNYMKAVDYLKGKIEEQADEIERLRGLFVLVSGFNEAPHPCKKEIDEIVDAALKEKE